MCQAYPGAYVSPCRKKLKINALKLRLREIFHQFEYMYVCIPYK